MKVILTEKQVKNIIKNLLEDKTYMRVAYIKGVVSYLFNKHTLEIVKTNPKISGDIKDYVNDDISFIEFSSTDFPYAEVDYSHGDYATPSDYDVIPGKCGGDFEIGDNFSVNDEETFDEYVGEFINKNKETILDDLSNNIVDYSLDFA